MATKKTKYITPSQYASWYGCTLANITKHIRNQTELPEVINIVNHGRFYTLEVPITVITHAE